MDNANKTPAANTNNDPYAIAYGEKYAATKGASRVELAKLIRADIKAAVAAGELPKAKYSVVCQSYSGGGSINVRIADVAKPGFVLANAARVVWDAENPHAGLCGCPSEAMARYSPEALEVSKKVERIMGAYNYDGSDIQSDYFNVRFYGHAEYDYRWADAKTEAESAAILAERAAARAPKAPELNAQEQYLAAMGAV